MAEPGQLSLAHRRAGVEQVVVLGVLALQMQPAVVQALAVAEAHAARGRVAELLASARVARQPDLVVHQTVPGLKTHKIKSINHK